MNQLLYMCIMILACITWKILDVFIKIFLEMVVYEDTEKKKRKRKRKKNNIMKQTNIKELIIFLTVIFVPLCYFVKNGYNFFASAGSDSVQIELYNSSHR